MTAEVISVIFAAFLASLVEAIEAVTIVLAVMVTRSVKWSLVGAFSALVTLVLIVLIVGPELVEVPIDVLHAVLGTYLIIFGMGWLKKAILRTESILPTKTEEERFEKEVTLLSIAHTKTASKIDSISVVTSFKAVLIEGMEVAIIVVTLGSGSKQLRYASFGAISACIAVVALALALRRYINGIPENTLKYVVGLTITALGIFFAGEGVGVNWPFNDLFIPVLFSILLTFSFIIRLVIRSQFAGLKT